jgi:hypothetical protein
MVGITGARWRRAGVSSTEQPRTDTSSRNRSPDHQYTLSIEQTAELYAKALKDKTIDALLERDSKTNIPIAGPQKMLGLPGLEVADRE